jgi:hypothetical protein
MMVKARKIMSGISRLLRLRSNGSVIIAAMYELELLTSCGVGLSATA